MQLLRLKIPNIDRVGLVLDISQILADRRFNILSMEVELNTAYVARFGFPFIYAVKGANKLDILAAFADRLANAPATEFATALAQISRIFRFRIEDRVRL